MSILEFVIGEVVRISVVFTDVEGTPTDPTDATLSVKTPDGEVEDITDSIFNDTTAVGAFYADYPITQAGDHYWRWEGSGALVAANEGLFCGKQSQFA